MSHKTIIAIFTSILAFNCLFMSNAALAYNERDLRRDISIVEYNTDEKREARAEARNTWKIIGIIFFGLLGAAFISVQMDSRKKNKSIDLKTNTSKDKANSQRDRSHDPVYNKQMERHQQAVIKREVESKKYNALEKFRQLQHKIKKNEDGKRTYHLCNQYMKLAEYYVEGEVVDRDIKQAEEYCNVAIEYAVELFSEKTSIIKIKEFTDRKNKMLKDYLSS